MFCSSIWMGVSGLEEGAKSIFKDVVIQRCIVHLIRNFLKYIPSKEYKAYTAQLKKVYGAPSLRAAKAEFERFKLDCTITVLRRKVLDGAAAILPAHRIPGKPLGGAVRNAAVTAGGTSHREAALCWALYGGQSDERGDGRNPHFSRDFETEHTDSHDANGKCHLRRGCFSVRRRSAGVIMARLSGTLVRTGIDSVSKGTRFIQNDPVTTEEET